MTKEELSKAKGLIEEIDKLEKICEFMNLEIDKYEFSQSNKMTGFDLTFRGDHKKNLTEEEIESIRDIFKSEIEKLTKELKQII